LTLWDEDRVWFPPFSLFHRFPPFLSVSFHFSPFPSPFLPSSVFIITHICPSCPESNTSEMYKSFFRKRPKVKPLSTGSYEKVSRGGFREGAKEGEEQRLIKTQVTKKKKNRPHSAIPSDGSKICHSWRTSLSPYVFYTIPKKNKISRASLDSRLFNFFRNLQI
jgi:hypothetical protein